MSSYHSVNCVVPALQREIIAWKGVNDKHTKKRNNPNHQPTVLTQFDRIYHTISSSEVRLGMNRQTIDRTHQQGPQITVIGDDSIVHDKETVFWPGRLWMSVHFTRFTVSGPAGMSYADMSAHRFFRHKIIGQCFCNKVENMVQERWVNL